MRSLLTIVNILILIVLCLCVIDNKVNGLAEVQMEKIASTSISQSWIRPSLADRFNTNGTIDSTVNGDASQLAMTTEKPSTTTPNATVIEALDDIFAE